MAAYMITYDLNSPGQNYDDVIKTIKDSSLAWCSYWESSYLIKTNLTPDSIMTNIKPYLDNGDKFIVIEVKNNYSGWLTEKQWKFIRENIF